MTVDTADAPDPVGHKAAPQILVNGIRTPDGTEIFSRFLHDFVEYVDANGEKYMVDGGTSYARGSVNNIPATPLFQYLTDDHDHNRQHMHWGTRGPDNNEPLTWVPLMTMSTNHIEAILRTQKHIAGSWMAEVFQTELEYRNDL